MEIARSETPAAVIDETIYVPGGLVPTAQGVGVAASVERYRTDTNTWDSVADMPAPRHHSMSVAVDGLVYVLGGFGDGFDPWATGWVFEPQPNGWSEIADLPLSVGAGAAVEIDGIIYVVGGVPLGTSLYAYDPAADIWDTPPFDGPAPRAHRRSGRSMETSGCWAVAGTRRCSTASRSSIPNTGSWSSGPSMQEARSGFGADRSRRQHLRRRR